MMILNKIKTVIRTFIKKSKFNFYFLILLGLFNVIFLMFALFFHDIFFEVDGFIFCLYHQDIVSNVVPPIGSEYWPPGIPVLIGLFSILTGDFFIVGKIIMVEFSILFLFSVYILINKIFNEKIAFFTFLFIATNHVSVNNFSYILSDIPSAALIILSMCFLIDDLNKSKSSVVYSSIFLGLATMIRWSGLFFLPILIFKIVFDCFKKSPISFNKKIRNVVLITAKCVFVFLLIVSPYLILNTIWHGTPFFNDNIRNVYISMQRYSGSYSSSQPFPKLSWGWIFFGSESNVFYLQLIYSLFIEYPVLFLQYLFYYNIPVINRFYELDSLIIVLSWALLICVFIGFYLNFKTKQKERKNSSSLQNLFPIFIIIVFFILASMGFALFRFLYPILPLLIAPLIFIVIFVLNHVFKLLQKFRLKIRKLNNKVIRKELISKFISMFLILLLSVQFFGTIVDIAFDRDEAVEYKIAGEFLKEKVNDEDIIIAGFRNYLYYIGKGNIIGLPDSTDINKFFIEIQYADYLIICKRIEVAYANELNFLLNVTDSKIPGYLNPIFIYNETGKAIVIYNITLSFEMFL